jgi:hypothetical protein
MWGSFFVFNIVSPTLREVTGDNGALEMVTVHYDFHTPSPERQRRTVGSLREQLRPVLDTARPTVTC